MSLKTRIQNLGTLVLVTTIICVTITGLYFYTDYMISKKSSREHDKSLTTIEGTIEFLENRNQSIAWLEGSGGVIINNESIINLLLTHQDEFETLKYATQEDTLNTIRILFDNGGGHELIVDTSDPKTIILKKDKYQQAYRSGSEIYTDLYMQIMTRSYHIEEAVLKAIATGKDQGMSINDTPNNVDVLHILKVADARYYLYERKGKYYCEMPYGFVRKISKEVYHDALQFTQP